MSFKSQVVRKAVDITPGTPYDFAEYLYVGVSGDVVVTQADGTTATYKDLSAGYWHPIASSNIVSSGTTATNMKAGY